MPDDSALTQTYVSASKANRAVRIRISHGLPNYNPLFDRRTPQEGFTDTASP